jgi:hypothetical protein
MDEYIEKLKKDPLVYYIYQTDLSIYGIEDKPYYTVIVDKTSNYPYFERTTGVELIPDNIAFYTMEVWFQMMNENALIVWICSCLDRKHIIKEYVKLMVPIDILKLRRNILDQLKYSDYQAYPDLDDCINEMIMDIIGLNLTNQIIEHHKIVNLKSPLTSCNLLLKSTDYYTTINKYKEIVNKYLEVLHKFTDDLYKQELIKKHLENE